jgi:hypothetical protein
VNNRTPIVAWRLALIGATLASLPSIAVGLKYGLLYCLFLSAPMILSTTVGLLVLTRIANRELRR